MAFTLPKLIRMFTTIPIKIPAGFFSEINKLIWKFWQKYEGLQIAKAVLKEKDKTGGLTLPGFKTCLESAIVKTVWCWNKDWTYRLVERSWKSRNEPLHFWSLTFHWSGRSTQQGKEGCRQTALRQPVRLSFPVLTMFKWLFHWSSIHSWCCTFSTTVHLHGSFCLIKLKFYTY